MQVIGKLYQTFFGNNNTNFVQYLPQKRRTISFILCSQHYPDTQVGQRWYMKGKLEINISHKHTCEILSRKEQIESNILYIKKIHHDQMEFIWGMQGRFTIQKSISVILYTNKLKKNHMIMSIDAEKSFDEIQCPFLIKFPHKLGG